VSAELVERMGSIKAAMWIQMLITGLYGALAWATTLIYESEKAESWSLAAVSLIHCVWVVGSFVLMALFLGWYHDLAGALIITGFQIVGYFIVWLILYFSYRKQIRELNELQKEIRDGK